MTLQISEKSTLLYFWAIYLTIIPEMSIIFFSQLCIGYKIYCHGFDFFLGFVLDDTVIFKHIFYNKNLKNDIRRFQKKCDIVEEPNSSSNHGIRVKFLSLTKRNIVF